ncbi:MFS transporter [Streptomyces nojiriensis]|uniref:MFS transporter n=1 Tax=Streptomyces nojiriensis TaxID=66374 RepID=A0ABQ3SHX8_9ACTN|nr:MFS transporter [Streptomyces nojiriensis]QTI49375.1 Multidrug resistance protein Stp [Streptomyces nojiriensis]GGS36713.1 MFS transporter [Streptomyces nojiriensis]GHI67753.1 MFS transporter [Streptomyces nojiriensis]
MGSTRTTEPGHGRQLLVLAICCLGVLLVSLDTTILNVALPAIRQDLNSSATGLQWTLDAYTIVLAALLTPAGSAADRLGRKRVFRLGLMLFTVGSTLCSLAPTTGWLVAFRTVQAAGGSMLTPVAMAVLAHAFPHPHERARAIGAWGAVVGLSMAAGPVLGGLLVQSAGWRSVFWVNVPIGLAALLLTTLHIPESRAPHPRRPDPVGQVLVTVVLGTLTYALIEGPGAGWTSPLVVAGLMVAAGALAGLVPYESRRDEPLIDPRLFRSVPFSGAMATAVFAFAALSGFLFANSVYLQGDLGLSPLDTGLRLLPMAAMSLLCPPLSGRIVGSRGPRVPLLIAGAGMSSSGALAALVTRSPHPSPLLLSLTYALFGLGFGFVNAPVTNTAVAGLPSAQAGVAASIAATSRQVGAALGIAVIGAAAASGARPAAWWAITGCGLAVAALAVGTARRTAAAPPPTKGSPIGPGSAPARRAAPGRGADLREAP